MSAISTYRVPRRRPLGTIAKRIGLYVSVILVCFAFAFPLYWMIVSSIIPGNQAFRFPPHFFPSQLRLDAYIAILEQRPIFTWMLNSLVVSLGTTFLTLVLSITGAYAISKRGWRGRRGLGFGLLLTQMVPSALLVIPIFIIFKNVGLLNSQPGLVIAHSALTVPIGIWVLKGFFENIPTEIHDAAVVDGSTELGVLARIVIPMSTPALVAVGVIAFFTSWDEYVFSALFIQSQSLRLFSVGISTFIGELTTPIDLIFAAATLFVIPPLVFYGLIERFLISGFSAGAVKG
jgi:multiple sugar transport system permease protein